MPRGRIIVPSAKQACAWDPRLSLPVGPGVWMGLANVEAPLRCSERCECTFCSGEAPRGAPVREGRPAALTLAALQRTKCRVVAGQPQVAVLGSGGAVPGAAPHPFLHGSAQGIPLQTGLSCLAF